MNKVNDEYNPAKMIAIVANPKTGEILAMSQRPSFDPETREGITDSWHNEAIETNYEPGSTMKIFTLAAAVEEGVFNPNEEYKSGRYEGIGDHNGGVGWGSISYLEGVQRSSNVAFAKLAKEKIGFDTFREYLTKFGLDQTTGIDLPREANSSIVFNWPIEKITTAFGQGTALTPIQQIQAATAVANDGKMVKPYVIEQIKDSNTGEVIKKARLKLPGHRFQLKQPKRFAIFLRQLLQAKKGQVIKNLILMAIRLLVKQEQRKFLKVAAAI